MYRKYKPKYYKYLKFLEKHSNYHILDIHLMIRKYRTYNLYDLQKLVNFHKQFGVEFDVVDLIILENEGEI